MSAKEKNVIYLDEDDNVLEGTANIQHKFDDYSKECARKIIRKLKGEYFMKKKKDKDIVLVGDAAMLIGKAYIPVFRSEMYKVQMGDAEVYVDNEDLAEILGNLTERQAKIIYLLFFQHEPPRVVVGKLNIKKKSFKKSKAGAMKKIRKGLVGKGYKFDTERTGN